MALDVLTYALAKKVAEETAKGAGAIKGDKGDPGRDGAPGAPGADGAPGEKGDKGDAFTYDDFTPEQLEALKGPKGDAGEQGAKGDTGEQGVKGDDGFSPAVTITDITGGHKVTITDATGDHSFNVMDGEGGQAESVDWSKITNKPTDLVQDASYVHTDNNFTDDDKGNVALALHDSAAAVETAKTANGIAYNAQGVADQTYDLLTSQVQPMVEEHETAIEDRYTKAEADALLADKADKATTYTKTETDALVEGEHIELTQAQYTALPEEEKNNGKVYFITDGGAYMPAVDLIPYVDQAPIVVGKLDLRGDGEFRDIKRVRLWINDLKNASGIITEGWTEEGVYVRPIRIYGWFTFHDRESTQAGFKTVIQQLPIPYSGYMPHESSMGGTIGLKFYVDHNNKLRMVVDGKSEFHTDDFACVIVDFMETPIT